MYIYIYSGLEHFDSATLQNALRPIEDELRNVDAEGFLGLDRILHDGAQLSNG
jgi:hypothetical protein